MADTNLSTLVHEASNYTLEILNTFQPYAVYITLGFLLLACPTLIFLIIKSSVVPVDTDTADIVTPNDPMTVYLKDLSTQICRYHNDAKRDFLHLSQRLAAMEAEIQAIGFTQTLEKPSRKRSTTAKVDLPKLESALLQLRKEMGAHTCLLRDEIVDTLNRTQKNLKQF